MLSLIRSFALVAILLLKLGSVTLAQPTPLGCNAPGISFGGASGTPTTVVDTVSVASGSAIEELHVEISISHTWVGDLIVDLTSPAGTTVRLHDGDGGNADDLQLTFADQGVVNGSVGYDFGCHMQPSPDALSAFAGEDPVGSWTLSVLDDFPSSDDGTIDEWCLTDHPTNTLLAPAVVGLSCNSTTDGAVLSWSNPTAYDSIAVHTNGVLTILAGSATTHTLTGYPAQSPISIAVSGTLSPTGSVGCPRECTATPTGVSSSVQTAVTIDGRYDDWSSVAAFSDPIGDDGPSAIDVTSLSLANDDEFLFVRLEVAGSEILLNDGNELVLYVDADDNASTGLAVAGIGAELEWRLGVRDGDVWSGGSATGIGQNDIAFLAQPNVSSTEFEMAISRASSVVPLGTAVRVAVIDEDGAGDMLPDAPGGVYHTLGFGTLPADSETPMERIHSTDLRFVSYNVLSNGPWHATRGPQIGRQLQAVAADVYCLQEVSSYTAAETLTFLASWVGPPAGSSWHAASQSDCKVISRFPILQQWSLSGNLAVWLDTTSEWGAPTLLINIHLPCCTNNTGRQSELDEIAAFIRDERATGVLATEPMAPIVITGDGNLVGDSQQVSTLLTGDVVDQAQWGADAEMDGDGTALEDALPRHLAKRFTHTWRSTGSSFWPGRLDYLVYSDSVLAAGRSFVLATEQLASSTLSSTGLLSDDSDGSDHLLLSVDFWPAATKYRRGDCNSDGWLDIGDPVTVLGVLFLAFDPTCDVACDGNGDGSIDVADPTYLLASIFGVGPVPPSPFPDCGGLPSPLGLDCTQFTACP